VGDVPLGSLQYRNPVLLLSHCLLPLASFPEHLDVVTLLRKAQVCVQSLQIEEVVSRVVVADVIHFEHNFEESPVNQSDLLVNRLSVFLSLSLLLTQTQDEGNGDGQSKRIGTHAQFGTLFGQVLPALVLDA